MALGLKHNRYTFLDLLNFEFVSGILGKGQTPGILNVEGGPEWRCEFNTIGGLKIQNSCLLIWTLKSPLRYEPLMLTMSSYSFQFLFNLQKKKFYCSLLCKFRH